MIITCIGDCGTDYYQDHEILHPGGITLNYAVYAHKVFPLSTKVEIITALGKDARAKLVRDTIEKYKIIPHITTLSGTTPIQYINHDARGEKQFIRYEEGVLRSFTIDVKSKKLIERSSFVMTVIFTQIEALFSSVMKCSTKGLMAVDFMDLSDYGKKEDIVKRYINRFDIGFFGLRLNDRKLLKILKELAAQYGKLFIITLGPAGSMAYEKEKMYFAPAVKVDKIVDTTGAGDAFAAAFTKEFLSTKDVEQSLRVGNDHAAKVVQQLGAF